MSTILGVDAAWTADEPSGVALVAGRGNGWQCLALAPSYESFEALSRGVAVDWSQNPVGSVPNARRLLEAASQIAGEVVSIVTIDMPVSLRAIAGRRTADRLVSQKFGSRWCSTHSPSTSRPGALGATLSQQFAVCGYPIATADTKLGAAACLLEVFPHVALLELLNREKRVPYKVAKSSKYWRGATINERIGLLLAEFKSIENALRGVIDGVVLQLPSADSVEALSDLKRYEDTLDALVCCWVGIQYAVGKANPLGDNECAIWCPRQDRMER